MAVPDAGSFMLLAEEPGADVVLAAVGRFWRRDYGWHAIAPDQFLDFDDPAMPSSR
jgi:hypothetical protein